NLGRLPENTSSDDPGVDTSAASFLNPYIYADDNPVSRIDPNGQQAVPAGFDTFTLRAAAVSLGVNPNQAQVQFNRQVGRMFQDFALASFGLVENFRPMYSQARASANFGLPASVIPDAVIPITRLTFRWGIIPWIERYPSSSFYEVKAVT